MLLEIIAFFLIGILFGTFTGLTPGIHINLVGAILVSLVPTLLYPIDTTYLVVFIVSMAITHTFIDFIPSVFLGCPDTDTELSILPGHQLLKKGQGYEAIMLTAYGSLAAVIITILISYPFVLIMKSTFDYVTKIIPYALILTSITMIFLESNKLKASVVFLLTGFLGVLVLNPNNILGNVQLVKEPLLPLLTGLFGSSALIISIKNKTKIPEQKITKPKIKLFKPLLGTAIASPICSLFPAIGSGQAAIIGNTISKTDNKGFLVLLGATNTLIMGFSFISLYAISKTRTGAAATIKNLIENLDTRIFILILVVILISGLISFLLTKKLAMYFSGKITKISYSTISLITLIILTIVTLLVAGWIGLIVLTLSTLTGIYSINSSVKRTNMMGCLLLPTILLYLF